MLQADCGGYAKKVSDGGYYKYQEENKMFLNWLGESSMSMAYGVMVYQSMVNWKPGPRSVYESKEGGNGGGKIESEVNEGRGGAEGWDMVEGGGKINGREYSQHAMERIAPDTPSVRAELSRRAEKLAEAKGLKVGTDEYYQFCKKYVDPRNIPPV